MDRGPDSDVTTEWDGWKGLSALARKWEHLSERLSLIGRMAASAWRWPMLDILCDPDARRRAAFCTVWSLDRGVSLTLGNQTGAA